MAEQNVNSSNAAMDDIIWSSDHESGTIQDWNKNQSGAIFNTGNASITATTEAAHTGSYSLKHQVNGISSQQVATRIFRWAEHLREGYYSCWYMFPKVPQVNGWLNIFQFKKNNDGTGATDPTWYNTVYNGRLYLAHWHNDSDVDNIAANIATPPQIVPGQWFHLEWHYKDGIADGEIGIWIDGQQYWDLKNVETRGIDPDIQWAPSLYGQNVTPDPLTMYIDDCAISTTRLGPDGLAGSPAQNCLDGTLHNQCSSTKPQYCSSGALVDKCSVCGCQSGQQCQSDGSCISTEEVTCGAIDTNGDEKLTRIDLASFIKAYGKRCRDSAPIIGCKGKDSNGDRKISLVDLANFVKKYNKPSCK